MKKIIATILTLVLVLSCFSTAVFAATAETVKQYGKEGGYLAIGDSICRGCGADGFYLDTDKASGGQYDIFEMRNVQGAVPYQIAQAVGCKAPVDITDQDATYWPFCYPGMTTSVVMDLLGIEDNFTDEALDYPYYSDMLKYFGYEGSFDGIHEGQTYKEGESGQCGNIIELIQKADLITVELGLCDTFYRAYRIATNGGTLAGGADIDLSDVNSILALAETAIAEMTTGYEYWKNYYPVVIEKIMELNPDATIVMVGSFNLLNQLRVTDDIPLPVGSVMSALSESMNKMYKQWEKKYGILYADVSNTETLATESDWSLLGDFMDNSFVGTHPSQTGYNYIVRQILSVLPEEEAAEEAASTDIVVDLGRFTKVDYVSVDGKRYGQFTMDGYVLKLPYDNIGAKNLTIGVLNDDGTVSVQTYSLSYQDGVGYTAHRLYGNNNAFGFLQPIIDAIKGFFQQIIDAIKGIFG